MTKQVAMLISVVFITFAGTRFVDGFKARDLQHALDTLASNEILRRAADSLSWEVRVAEVSDDLGAELLAMSDSAGSLEDRTATLIETVEDLQGRVATATQVSVDLIAALDSEQAETFVNEQEAVDSIAAPYDDGLLSGRIAFYPPVQRFSLEYMAQIRGSLVTAELPDGRWSVMAMAEDTARVSFTVPSVFIDLADPVPYCSFVQKGKWGLIGYLARWVSSF